MNITVTTKSGSIYRFSQTAGKTFIVKAGEWAGEVIAFQKDAIRVGKSMEMIVQKKGAYYKGANGIEPLSTTLVKDISVKF